MATVKSATRAPEARSFTSAANAFADGTDTPRGFLERCIATIAERDGEIGAFVATNLAGAREAADAAGERWKAGRMLSPVDGMPLGVKDIMETADMPTGQGSPLFDGWRGGRDCAAVAALREAGAVIVGKTVTTEFAGAEPRGTRNPWDLTRTPGGSSSGSVAAVAAGMVPAALGSQGLGSTIRPSSYCGCFGYKPSLGGLNRGGSFDVFSQSCSSVLAATLGEAWIVARAISARAGGDPGFPGVSGPLQPPEPMKPRRAALLRTAGWKVATADAQQALQRAVAQLRAAGIDCVAGETSPLVAAVETEIADAMALTHRIHAWEGRWPLNTYARDMDRSKLSQISRTRLAEGEQMTQVDYLDLLRRRDKARATYAALKPEFDLCVTLSATGPAPLGLGSTGDAAFAVASSVLGVPALSLPVLTTEGLPLGLQLIGFANGDAALFAAAAAILPITGGAAAVD